MESHKGHRREPNRTRRTRHSSTHGTPTVEPGTCDRGTGMIADMSAPRSEHWRAYRLLGFLRDAFASLISPAMALVARAGHRIGRVRARRQLAAGTSVRHAPIGAPGSARRVSSLATTRRERSRSPIARPRAPRFSTVRVTSDFSPREYTDTFRALQIPPAGKVLDLVPAHLLCADVFERLGAAWTAESGAVPRLAILLSFERWVMLRDAALASLQPLAARGVRVEVFYAEQAAAGFLADWFGHGRILHNVRGVIATLTRRWYPSPSWRTVIDTLGRLVRACTPAGELPAVLTQIAALALSCGGAVEAAALAREALLHLPESASATRSQALRMLGTALICQEQTTAGLVILDQAFAVAAEAEAPDIGASAMCHSGLCALNHGDYHGAELRFRRAIELLAPPIRLPHLVALAHHNLAVALMHQGRPGAEYHARTALALRPDPESHLAEQDRILLAKLREIRCKPS